VSYGYNDAGRLEHVDPSHPLPRSPAFTHAYEPDSLGLLATVTGPVHTVDNTWKTDRDALDVKKNWDGTSTTFSRYDYGINALGQRDSVATSGTAFTTAPQWAWAYNHRGELVEANDTSTADNDRAYQFDAIGNRQKTADREWGSR